MSKAHLFYENQLKMLQVECIEASKSVRLFSILRLSLFLISCTLAWFFFGKWPFFIGVIVGFITFFLILLSFSVNAKLKFEKAQQKQKINEAELRQLKTASGQFDCGSEFANSNHPFTNDLDFYTPHGFFSLLNRTTSKLGKETLNNRLTKQGKVWTKEERQSFEQLTLRLQEHLVWTQEFRASASIASREDAFSLSLSSFVKKSFLLSTFVRFQAFLIPLLSISTLIVNQLGIIGDVYLGFALILSFILVGSSLKETNLWAAEIGKYESKVKIVLDQLILVKKLPFSPIETKHLQEMDLALVRWIKIAKGFDLRMNILISIPLNLFFAYDLWLKISFEKWMNRYGTLLAHCEEELAEIEILISAATLKFNTQEQTTFAQNSENRSIRASKLTHPLLHQSKAIPNDFEMEEDLHFVILTGPNMAGKSTFLRSVGLNIVLANACFPVFAENFKLPIVQLFSSMRTSDDLSRESSYFHAELTRLKFIQEQIDTSILTFVLLDEILKGTNSKDKEEGSKKFLEKMSRLGAKGIIATHDLSLCTLSEDKTHFENYFFDSTIENNELSFDYQIKKGVCQNMNASFLLKKMNLVD